MRRERRDTRLRQRLAREAARLMYEEDVKQYLDAKHLAARRVLGRREGRGVRYRPHDLPSNGEIRDALLELAALVEGHERADRLFAMRVEALIVMEALDAFHPGLIGSVSTGAVRRGSDIDVHVFTDDEETLELRLFELGWIFELSTTTISKNGVLCDYTHVHIQRTFPVELSVYPTQDRRLVTRSSTDGKPIVRLKPAALRALIAREHPSAWEDWQRTGVIPHLERFEDEERALTLADVDALVDGLDEED